MSPRSSRGGTKTGLERAAEIESTVENDKKKKPELYIKRKKKCDSIEIHVVTMCFSLDAKTDAKLNKITALSLSLSLCTFLVCS